MYNDEVMRTTLDIDEDVLETAKELAARRRTTAGRILSELARRALMPQGSASPTRNGVPILPSRKRSGIVTPSVVNRLRDEV